MDYKQRIYHLWLKYRGIRLTYLDIFDSGVWKWGISTKWPCCFWENGLINPWVFGYQKVPNKSQKVLHGDHGAGDMWVVFGVNVGIVGKYFSTLDHVGMLVNIPTEHMFVTGPPFVHGLPGRASTYGGKLNPWSWSSFGATEPIALSGYRLGKMAIWEYMGIYGYCASLNIIDSPK